MTAWHKTPKSIGNLHSRLCPGLRRLHGWLLLLLVLAGCGTPTPQAVRPPSTLQPGMSELNIVTGQTVFVPAYSHIFYGSNRQTMNMAITLAIHNTDLETPIIIQSVRYYDTDGNLVREFVEQPVELGPMATTGFLVPEGDMSGGWGSNFMVEWVAQDAVFEPVVEAVMVNASSGWGASFVSVGRVVSEHRPGE